MAKPARDDDWFRRKVAELGQALERIPEHRRQLAARELGAGGSRKARSDALTSLVPVLKASEFQLLQIVKTFWLWTGHGSDLLQ
jgi:hypothetical protein